MRNIKLVLEFDGTAYAGWQIQPERATVQGSVINAVSKLTGEDVRLTGAGRTDAGVHARAYVCNFQSSSAIPTKGVREGLNSLLPEDIAVIEASEVPDDFDSRRSAKSKSYLYRVFNAGYRTPLERHYSWSVKWPLDLGLMQRGAELFLGEKDFSSFCAADSDAEHCIRRVIEFDVDGSEGDFIELSVRGTAFLRHMVRIMVGTLVTLGRGKITLEDIEDIIEAKDRTRAPVTAPARGLFFMRAEY